MSHNVNRFVFLHGGPGFNSIAEEAILSPIFEAAGNEIHFWNEPSRLRPNGEVFEAAHPFECWLASATSFVLRAAEPDPVHLITHSFAVHAGLQFARRHPTRLASLVLVAPGADAFLTFTNILRLAHEDLVGAKPEAASAIAECLERTRAVLDESMRIAMMNALHDTRLFSHYWADSRQFEISMAALAQPEGHFDAESFFAVLTGFGERGASLLSTDPVTVPTLALFGGSDRITPLDEQRRALEAAVPAARMKALDGCSHYVHLDRPRHFTDIVLQWVTANSGDPVARF